MCEKQEGISIYDPTVIKREAKCWAVFKDLASQPVRLMRSPPGSGKTSFGVLMQNFAAAAGHEVHLLSMSTWAETQSVHAWWHAVTGTPMATALNPTMGERRTFIIDEAQLLYQLSEDDPFWRALKAINAASPEGPGAQPRVQVLLLAVYAVRAHADHLGAPIELPAAYSMSTLRLDSEEVAAFFRAFNETCEAKGHPRIPPGLQEAMQRVCNSHVGLLRACVRAFCNAFKTRAPVSAEQEADFAAAQLVNLGADLTLRALPELSRVQPAEAAVIRRVSLAGAEGIELTETELVSFPRRLVTAGVFDMASSGSCTRVAFSSPAMRTHAAPPVQCSPSFAAPRERLVHWGQLRPRRGQVHGAFGFGRVCLHRSFWIPAGTAVSDVFLCVSATVSAAPAACGRYSSSVSPYGIIAFIGTLLLPLLASPTAALRSRQCRKGFPLALITVKLFSLAERAATSIFT